MKHGKKMAEKIKVTVDFKCCLKDGKDRKQLPQTLPLFFALVKEVTVSISLCYLH